jgi:phosphoribosylamine-glycine ligase
MKEAQKKAYKAIDEIHPDVIYYRKDIGNKNLM